MGTVHYMIMRSRPTTCRAFHRRSLGLIQQAPEVDGFLWSYVRVLDSTSTQFQRAVASFFMQNPLFSNDYSYSNALLNTRMKTSSRRECEKGTKVQGKVQPPVGTSMDVSTEPDQTIKFLPQYGEPNIATT